MSRDPLEQGSSQPAHSGTLEPQAGDDRGIGAVWHLRISRVLLVDVFFGADLHRPRVARRPHSIRNPM